MTGKGIEGNEDWIRREEGRVPSKGAMAAERASAGLGTSDDDSSSLFSPAASPAVDVWHATGRNATPPRKPAPPR